MALDSDFDDFEGQPQDGAHFVVDVAGYEGPLDVLLTLAREQKVDLVHVSILDLADQFLGWVAEARRSNLELAADYLVMAAWLAYLKSRLLLPEPEGEEEPSGEEMAAALQFQLQRLEAMQQAGATLMARPRRGQDFHVRGMPERFGGNFRTVYETSLYDLLRAYADQRRRADTRTMHIEPLTLYSVDDALKRIRSLLGHAPDWQVLQRFLPEGMEEPLAARSALAATFTAVLELAREGRLSVRQDGLFAPIFVRGGAAGGRPEGDR
jgi:segregation and condensation protein A